MSSEFQFFTKRLLCGIKNGFQNSLKNLLMIIIINYQNTKPVKFKKENKKYIQ